MKYDEARAEATRETALKKSLMYNQVHLSGTSSESKKHLAHIRSRKQGIDQYRGLNFKAFLDHVARVQGNLPPGSRLGQMLGRAIQAYEPGVADLGQVIAIDSVDENGLSYVPVIKSRDPLGSVIVFTSHASLKDKKYEHCIFFGLHNCPKNSGLQIWDGIIEKFLPVFRSLQRSLQSEKKVATAVQRETVNVSQCAAVRSQRWIISDNLSSRPLFGSSMEEVAESL